MNFLQQSPAATALPPHNATTATTLLQCCQQNNTTNKTQLQQCCCQAAKPPQQQCHHSHKTTAATSPQKQYQQKNYCFNAGVATLPPQCHYHSAAAITQPCWRMTMWEWHGNTTTVKTIPPLQCHGYNITGTLPTFFKTTVVSMPPLPQQNCFNTTSSVLSPK